MIPPTNLQAGTNLYWLLERLLIVILFPRMKCFCRYAIKIDIRPCTVSVISDPDLSGHLYQVASFWSPEGVCYIYRFDCSDKVPAWKIACLEYGCNIKLIML